MPTNNTLRAFLEREGCKVVIAADGQTRGHVKEGTALVERPAAGGVPVAFDRVSQVAGATYIGRARSREDVTVLDEAGAVRVSGDEGSYSLKRVAVNSDEVDDYYYGYSNQSLWPLFHTAYEKPVFDSRWYEGYRRVSRKFAQSIRAELDGRTLVWVNDYQLALVPSFLPRQDGVSVAFFWHIPWPCWEVFRILPQRRAILGSLLRCEFIGFHTEEYARNFLEAARHEFAVEVDAEKLTARMDGHTVRATVLPVGVDSDVIRKRVAAPNLKPSPYLNELFDRYTVLCGADRLDYTKGIPERLQAIDAFLRENPEYVGRLVYLGVMSPTREAVPAYRRLKHEVARLGRQINRKYATRDWHPLHLSFDGMARDELLKMYARADACLVTPLSDGMNLVAKEYVTAAACSETPGMLVLSEYAGAASQLTEALLVNPYDTRGLSRAIRDAVEMPVDERRQRMTRMARLLDRENVYVWAQTFLRGAIAAEDQTVHRVA